MSDKIEEIRERHTSETGPRRYELKAQIHDDRAFLLAEVDRQRAENERLYNEDTKTRHALKGWVYVCPDGGDEPTHERVAAVVAEVERQRAEIKRLSADRRERIATAALQGMLSNPHNSQWEPQDYFRSAVYYADGLIAELDKEEEEGKP